MSHATDYNDMPARRIEAVAPGLRIAVAAMIIIGALTFAAALMTDATRAWQAYHYNWLFFLGIAQGGFMLAVLTSITKGLWARPIRRIALAHSAFLPIAFLLIIPYLIWGAPHVMPWIEHPLHNGKEAWLNHPFLTARTLFGLAVLIGLSLAFTYTALRPDMGLMRDQVPPRLHGLYGAFTRNWRGQEAEELHAFRRLGVLGPAIALAYALFMGVIAWDYIMSLEPTWFSTLIGPYYFMGSILGGFMTTALIIIALRSRLALESWITPATLHDLGKLCFGFTIFWGYMFFSQYIVIWYGLLPHEQAFVIHRFTPPFRIVAQIVALCLFAIPFFGLMGVTPKRTPAVFATFASISLFGLWLERYLITYPSLYLDDHHELTVTQLPFSWQEPGMLVFFGGLYLAAIAFFLTRVPLFQMWQPASDIELQGIAVEQRHMTGDLGGAGSRPE